jgi:Flp pilus assembly protein TadG
MPHGNPFRDLISREDGSFVGTAIFLALIIGVLAIVIIDGSSVFYASQAAADGAQQAANLAQDTYKETRSDVAAENAAADYCEGKDLSFDKFEIIQKQGHTYSVTCSKDASTFVFKRLPYFEGLIHQEATKSSQMY